MLNKIIKKIDNLPPLPQTIIKIEEFRKKPEKDSEELLKIIEKDALIVSTLLKIANSAMFGFRSKVETPSRIINLLGINFTIYITINETIQNILKTDLEPYQITTDDFMEASNIASIFANVWLSKIDNESKEEMILASLLQETGKFILAELIISNNKTKEFIDLINSGEDLTKIEQEILETTTSKTTAEIFKHWKLSSNLVKMIEFVDDIENCEEEYKQKAQILNIIKTVCNPKELFTEKSIEKALFKSDKYNFDKKPLAESIIFVRDKIRGVN